MADKQLRAAVSLTGRSSQEQVADMKHKSRNPTRNVANGTYRADESSCQGWGLFLTKGDSRDDGVLRTRRSVGRSENERKMGACNGRCLGGTREVGLCSENIEMRGNEWRCLPVLGAILQGNRYDEVAKLSLRVKSLPPCQSCLPAPHIARASLSCDPGQSV